MTNVGSLGGPQRDLVGYGGRPPRVIWPNGAALALSLIVAYEEGSEYGHTSGDNRNEQLTEVGWALEPEYRDLAGESVYEIRVTCGRVANPADARRVRAEGRRFS